MTAWIRRGLLAFILGLGLHSGAFADSLSSTGWTWWDAGGGQGTSGVTSSPVDSTTSTGASASTPASGSVTSSTEPTLAPLLLTPPAGYSAYSTPDFTSNTQPAASTSLPTYEGFINFGSGPYPATGVIASGNPQPWYDSPEVANLFGGTPNAQQQADFTQTVLQRIEQTFQLSGVPVTLTTDPNAAAAHTLSVVSNSSSIPFPNSIGTSDLGSNGFSFIDQIAKSAQSVDQLEWIVAHNVSHELMLTFGVPEKYDQTGNYIDATNANWSMITNPNATFSPAAAAAINQSLQAPAQSSGASQFAQNLDPQPVPEPTTLILWGVTLLAVTTHSRSTNRFTR